MNHYIESTASLFEALDWHRDVMADSITDGEKYDDQFTDDDDDELIEVIEDITQTNLRVLWDEETKKWKKP